MSTLAKMFPSLSLFSDLNWDDVTQEYETSYIDRSFPEYLQEKAEEGDAPPYLFELAFYEQGLFEVRSSDANFPHQAGVYLNPTALFLSLEFDVVLMISDAARGDVNIIEKDHVLAIYKDPLDQLHTIELSPEDLMLLEMLEEGPVTDKSFLTKEQKPLFTLLVNRGLILDLT